MNHLDCPARGATPVLAAPGIRCENLLLAALPSAERRRLIACCEPVQLNCGDVLCEQGERISHVYFPLDSFISLISSIDERSSLEVGLVGAEGMLGVSLLLGVNIALAHALVQGAGSALRLQPAQFSRELKRCPALEQTLKRYLYVFTSQLAQMAACSHTHFIQARLARLLLMRRDQAHSDVFRFTQEVGGSMLGVRRVSITMAACALQKRNLIRYQRGKVTILYGRGLEAASCPCYAAATQMYARVMK